MRTRPLLALLTLIAVVGAGCGVRPSGVITGGPAPSGPAIGPPGPSTLTAPAEDAVLYFLLGSSLTPVRRRTRGHVSPAKTLALLQDGPDAEEKAANLTSEVPAALDPVTVDTSASGHVQVVVSADVTTLSAAAVDQIVCTVDDALSTTAPVTLTSGAETRGPRACPLAR